MQRKTLLSALAPVFSFLTLLTLAAAAGAPGGEITATPSTVLLQPVQSGETVISWTTSGCADAMVIVSTEADPAPVTFAQGTSNADRSAPWISEGRLFFRLYADLRGNLLLDEVVVTGRRSPRPDAGQRNGPYDGDFRREQHSGIHRCRGRRSVVALRPIEHGHAHTNLTEILRTMKKKNNHPLRVGLVGSGLEAYWPQFDGLKPNPEGYLGQVTQKPGPLLSMGVVRVC